MKRSDLLFAGLLVPLDYVALILAGWTAYTLRFDSINGLLPAAQSIPAGDYLRTVLIVAIGWVGVLAMAGAYSLRQRQLPTELGRIFLGASTAVLLIIVVIFFQREFFTSRFIILAGWVLATIFLWISHIVVRGIQYLTLRSGYGIRQLVVFGNDQITNDLLMSFRTHPGFGLRVLRHFPEMTPATFEEFDQLLQQHAVDDVLQADPHAPRAQTLELIDRCLPYSVRFRYAADQFNAQASQLEMDYISGVPVMELKRTPLDGWGRILKRTFDMVGAMLLIIILALPCLLVAIIIRLDSAGPIFFKANRVGEGQKRFQLWKFRSMIRDAQAMKTQLMDQNERGDGPLFKISNDPRITRFGRVLRKTSIDELPQLMNVLRGEMSLVGPRPHEPEEVARYDKHHKKLLTIKPGMTGMAQVSGRSSLGFEDEVRLDTYYIEHWSLSLDVQILLRTPWAVISARHVA